MKHKRNVLAPLLVAPALLAMGSAAGDSPAFGPAEGTTFSKRITQTTSVVLDDMTMIMSGQDMSDMMGEVEMETETTLAYAITDTYEGVADGRPTKLRRTFDELSSESTVSSSNPMAGDMDMDIDGSSELEGTTVVFTWDADLEDYSVAFADDSGGDDELLEDLRADMDLRALLPETEKAVGDAWDVDPTALRVVIAPGGSLKVQPDDSDMAMMGGSNQPSNFGEFIEEFEGEVTAQFEEIREVDGARVAIITLTVDVSAATDMTEYMQEMMSNAEMPEGMEVEMDVASFDMEYAFQGSGELLWNLDAGLYHSFELTGDVEQIADTAINMSMGGQEQALEQSMVLSGTQTIRFAAADE